MSPAESPLRGSARAPLAAEDATGVVDAMDVVAEQQQQEEQGQGQEPQLHHTREGGSQPRAVAMGDDLDMEAAAGGGGEEEEPEGDKTQQPQEQQQLQEQEAAGEAGEGDGMEMETGVGVGGGVEAPPSSPVRPSGGEPGGAPAPAAVTGSAERKDTEDGGEPAAAGDQEEKEGGDGEMEEGDGEVTVVEPPAQPPLPDIPTNGAHVTKRGKGLLEFTVALEPPLLPLKPPAAAEPVDAEAEAEADARAAAIAEKLGKVKAYTEWVDDAKGCGWRVMYFPYGNPHKGVVRGPHTFKLGVYVELKPTSMEVGKEGGAGPAKEGKEGGGDEEEDEEAEDVPYCRRYVRVTCAARHRGEGPAAAAAMREARNTVCFEFTSEFTDQGWEGFLPAEELRRDPLFLHDGKLLIDVKIEDLPGYNFERNYDSRKEIGLVGLRNQGATCYMNSLLQFLWSVRELRRAVYAIPTEGEEQNNSVALELQRVFYSLQTRPAAVGTLSLTKAFGWSTADAFVQHDIQELNRVLCDRLEEKMKGTVVDGTLKALFGGTMRPTTRCLPPVDYVSSREEEYYDIQLNVKGCKDLAASLAAFVLPEKLDGDNKYFAEGHGKVDAERYTRFASFPPVLLLHLKRFEFDFRTMNMCKVNQRFEFPTTADLAPYLDGPERAAQEAAGGPLPYRLHAVFVHTGDVSSGHYYAYVRQAAEPAGEDGWARFDDETVMAVEEAEVLADGFGAAVAPAAGGGGKGLLGGGSGPISLLGKGGGASTSAYMLVYVRESEWARLMRPLAPTPGAGGDLPAALAARFERERAEAERRRKEEREKDLYLQVGIYGPRAVTAHGARRLSVKWDWVPPPPAAVFERGQAAARARGSALVKVRKAEPVAALMLRAREALGIPLHRQRLWVVIGRQNGSTRIGDPLLLPTPEQLAAEEAERRQAEAAQPLFQQQRNKNEVVDPVVHLLSPATELLKVSNTSGGPCVFVEDTAWTAWSSGEGEGEEGEEEGAVTAMAVDAPEAEAAGAVGGGKRPRPTAEEKGGEGQEQQDGQEEAEPASPALRGPPAKKPKPAADGERGGAGGSSTAPALGLEEMGARAQTAAEAVAFVEAHPPREPPADEALIFFKRYDSEAPFPAQEGAEGEGEGEAGAAAGPLSFLMARFLPTALTPGQALAMLRAREPGALAGWLPDEGEEGVDMYEMITARRFNLMLPRPEPKPDTDEAEEQEEGEEGQDGPPQQQPPPQEETLHDREIMTGDVLVLQRSPPAGTSPAKPGPGALDRVLNTGRLPPRAPHFVSLLLQRRVFHFRPLGPVERELLRRCAAHPEAGREGAPGRAMLVRGGGEGDEATELVIEALSDAPYAHFQRALHRFLRHGGLVDAGRLRLHPAAPDDPNYPSVKFRPAPRAQDLQTRIPADANAPQPYGAPEHPTAALFGATAAQRQNAARVCHALFEVLPFSLQELRGPPANGWEVRDVVVHDARLRRRAASVRGLVNWAAVEEEFGKGAEAHRAGEVEVVDLLAAEGGEGDAAAAAGGAAAAAAVPEPLVAAGAGGGEQQLPPAGLPLTKRTARCRRLKGVWTEFLPPPSPQAAAEGGAEQQPEQEAVAAPRPPEPLVLSLLTGPEATVEDVLQACAEALGLAGDEVDLGDCGDDGARLPPGRLELVESKGGEVNDTLKPDWSAKEMPGSLAMGLRAKPGPKEALKGERAVLHWVDAVEDQPFVGDEAERGEGGKGEGGESLAAVLQQEQEQEQEAGDGGDAAVDAGAGRRRKDALLMEVVFYQVKGNNYVRPQGNDAPVRRPLSATHVGLPLLVTVTSRDTRASVLGRIAAKLGVPVAALEERWLPALELRDEFQQGIYPLPADAEEGAEGEAEEGAFLEALLDHCGCSKRVRLYKGLDRREEWPQATDHLRAPAIIFYHAEPVGVPPAQRGGVQRLQPRRVSQGIRIREG